MLDVGYEIRDMRKEWDFGCRRGCGTGDMRGYEIWDVRNKRVLDVIWDVGYVMCDMGSNTESQKSKLKSKTFRAPRTKNDEPITTPLTNDR